MKKLKLIVTALSVLVMSIAGGQAANAGQLSSNGATISWNDANFYYPTGCSSFTFNYTLESKVLLAEIKVTNKFGDNVGSTILTGTGTNGATNLQICSTYAKPELAPFELTFEVNQSHSVGNGSVSVVTAPLVFLSRTSASNGSKVCVNKKSFNLTRANASGKCSSGWVLRTLK